MTADNTGHPNQIGRDPDIASRALAFAPGQSRDRRGAGAWLDRRQSWLFFPMLLLEGLNLHAAGLRALLSQERPKAKVGEACLLAAHIGGAFCASRDIPYCETGLLASYAQVLRHLHAAGRPQAES